MYLGFFIVLCVFFIPGCKSGENNDTVTDNPVSVQFRLSPELNKEYRYSIISESEMVQEINDKEIESTNKLDIQTVYRFSKDTSGILRLNVTYETFKLAIKAFDQEKELDAATASLSFIPSDKMFAAFDKAEISAAIDSTGSVSSVDGANLIRNKMAGYAGNNEDALALLNGSIKQYVGEQFFRQSIENCLKAFTTRKLKTGDTVVVTAPVGGEFNISASVVYKLVSIRKGVADISISADVEMKDQDLTVENTAVKATISGRQTGALRINVGTGMVEKTETYLDMKGTMQVLGREIPFKMKTRNAITRLTD